MKPLLNSVPRIPPRSGPAVPLGVRVEQQVHLGDRSYPILIGEGLLQDAGIWRRCVTARQVVIITNERVGPLYLAAVVSLLRDQGLTPIEVVLPDGEAHKTIESFMRIMDALMSHRVERKSLLVALGGGVIGDMVGFAASCYQRGVPFIQVPTSLLAQVDSSVGGKTAINHPLGKNMIGAFYQPQAVLIDLKVLGTLPDRELSAGLAEVIKYGAALDLDFFQWLEVSMPALRARDPDVLTYAVQRCCELKARVVAEDERESGQRALLNFGHTFGHAIEAEMGFGSWLHGEAVGCGMVMAAALSVRLGSLTVEDANRIKTLVEQAGLPVRPPDWPASRYLSAMAHDKKAEAGEIRYVVLNGLGQAHLQAVASERVAEMIDALRLSD